jgi:hypothetical protein
MPIQRIHPRKLLITPLARKRPIIRMQLLVPLIIMLPRKPFPAPRPLVQKRLLFIVAPYMRLQVEGPAEGRPAPGHGAKEDGFLLVPVVRRWKVVREVGVVRPRRDVHRWVGTPLRAPGVAPYMRLEIFQRQSRPAIGNGADEGGFLLGDEDRGGGRARDIGGEVELLALPNRSEVLLRHDNRCSGQAKFVREVGAVRPR